MARKKPAKRPPKSPETLRPGTRVGIPTGYGELLEVLKSRVRAAQTKATFAVNRELIGLYWDIGRMIVERQQRDGWGKGIVDRLAVDIQNAFPGLSGFSSVNVWRMRALYVAYRSDRAILSQAVTELPRKKAGPPPKKQSEESPPDVIASIPWGHNVVLLTKVKETEQRLWYAAKTAEHGWSRAVLTVQIETDLFRRQGTAVTNFASRLPAPQSDLAQQTIKDPYLFDFLTLQKDAIERDLELALIDHIQKFLMELGAGFAFVGRQVPLAVGDGDFYLDLLFYHLKLRCFVVIDLKMEKFSPEDAGKMNFYLSAVDDQMRHPDDQPSIGLILCKRRDKIIAEYALRDILKPIGVSEWQTKLVQSLPTNLRGSLPTIEEIELELGGRHA
ncbi:MAG: DUF1016 family protein [Planctomycetes bacterium]|nr:DUF1016 family protein [Planctomycetota bacterium]